MNKVADFFGYDEEATEEFVGSKESANDSKPMAANVLRAKEGLSYVIALLPYIHFPKPGIRPIIEVWMHYGINGKSFACLYKNGIDEKCNADAYVQMLWDQYKEVRNTNGGDKNHPKCKAILKTINACKAKPRWYSPIKVVDVFDKEDNRVDEEYEKYCNQPYVWLAYPKSVVEALTKINKRYGAIWNPMKPVFLDFSREKKTDNQGRKSDYLTPTIQTMPPLDEVLFNSEKEAVDVIKSIPDIFESGVFSVISNAEIAQILRSSHESVSFNPADFEMSNTNSSDSSDSSAEELAASSVEDPFTPNQTDTNNNTSDDDDSFKDDLDAVLGISNSDEE